MTTTNTPFEEGLDEIFAGYAGFIDHEYQGVAYDREDAIRAITQLHKAAIVTELEALLELPNIQYQDPHVEAIYKSAIRDHIEQYKKEGEK